VVISDNFILYFLPKIQPKRKIPATNGKKLIPKVDGLCDEPLHDLLEK